MYRRLISFAATLALTAMLGGTAVADPPVVGASAQPDQSSPAVTVNATVPTETTTDAADLHSTEPITVKSGAGDSGSASSSGTAVSGPGVSASIPVSASRGSIDPTTSPSTESPTATLHASVPTDTSVTTLQPNDQTLVLRSARTSAGAAMSDPSAADANASFCFAAHANEANTPTADISSVCGGSPSTVSGSVFSDERGAAIGSGGVDASACATGDASGAGTPATADVNASCPASDSSATADRSTRDPDPTRSAAENAWTPVASGEAAALIARLPFTGTASTPIFGTGLVLIGAGFLLLRRSRKTG